MLNDLKTLLGRRAFRPEHDDAILIPPPEFCSPGYWVAYAARARMAKKRVAELGIPAGKLLDYAKAIRIEAVLGEKDTYPYQRVGSSHNYSPLVVLDDVDETNNATRSINSCLREMFPRDDMKSFISQLGDVVGDLHDNVWSHGESTGISMAQRWKKPNSNGEHSFIEFALADCGIGFLGELKRSGIAKHNGISNDQEAIAWCIQQGNSSKKKDEDPWMQSLPSDVMGNPMGTLAKPKMKENHHQGLGLFKLCELVNKFNGSLWLASGNAMLHIDVEAPSTLRYATTRNTWDGVALACRFCTDNVAKALGSAPQAEPVIDDILAALFR